MGHVEGHGPIDAEEFEVIHRLSRCDAQATFSRQRQRTHLPRDVGLGCLVDAREDRKSTRLNSSHPSISYAVFCLKKKKKITQIRHVHQKDRSPVLDTLTLASV